LGETDLFAGLFDAGADVDLSVSDHERIVPRTKPERLVPCTECAWKECIVLPSVQDLVAVIEERAIRSRIKQARKEAGLTQEQIAELIGVEDRTYQNYEREDDKGRTPWRMMNAIAAATGKPQEWLLHGDAPDLMTSLNGTRGPLGRRLTTARTHRNDAQGTPRTE
jgi:transcriptional regulator with XRE-family HTH domain